MFGISEILARWFGRAPEGKTRRARRTRRRQRSAKQRKISPYQTITKITFGFFLVGCSANGPFMQGRADSAIDVRCKSDDSSERLRAYREIARMAESPNSQKRERAEQLLLECAKLDNSQIGKATILEGLSAFDSDPAVKAVLDCTNSEYCIVRAEAAKALGRQSRIMIGRAELDVDTELKHQDREFVQKHGSKITDRPTKHAALGKPIIAAATPRESELKTKMLTALETLACSDTSADVRLVATGSLCVGKETQALKALAKCANDRNFTVAKMASGRLAEITGKDCGTDTEAWIAALGKGTPKDADVQPVGFAQKSDENVVRPAR